MIIWIKKKLLIIFFCSYFKNIIKFQKTIFKLIMGIINPISKS